MKKRIIINIQDNTDIEDAVRRVLHVISGGRISQTGDGTKHYCWITTWTDGIVVGTNRKKNKNTDSFNVWKSNNPKE